MQHWSVRWGCERFSFLKSVGNFEQSRKLIRKSSTTTSTQVEDEPLHWFERQYAESGGPGNLADLITLRVGSVENFPNSPQVRFQQWSTKVKRSAYRTTLLAERTLRLLILCGRQHSSTSRNASLSPIHCINVMQCISLHTHTHTQLLVQVSGTGTANGMHSYLLPIQYYPSLASRTKLSCADSRRKVKGSFD